MKRNSFIVGEIHSFSRTLAKEYSINAAILMAFLANRITSVQSARKDNLGYFQSVRVIKKHYPYLTTGAISYALKQLREAGVLNADSHNRLACDKTLWYTFADPQVQKMALEDPVRFNVEAAKQFGVETALVLANLDYWIRENQKKDNTYDWHRFSPPELAKHLPLSERTIRRILNKMSEGEENVLERKRGVGCDQAFQYRFFCASECHRSNLKSERSESEIQRSDSQVHRPEMNIQRSKLRTYTLYEDTFGKTPVQKNLWEEPVIEQRGFASGCDFSYLFADAKANRSLISSSLTSPPSITASSVNSRRNDVLVSASPSSDANGCSDVKASALITSFEANSPALSPCHRFGVKPITLLPAGLDEAPLPSEPAPPPNPVELVLDEERKGIYFGIPQDPFTQARMSAQKMTEYDRRCVEFASPYASLEDKKDLTAEEKMRVFRAAIYSKIRIGCIGADGPWRISYTSKTFDTAKRFFELNPSVAVSDVLFAIDGCNFAAEANGEAQEEGFDPCFYERRAYNLDFFFKHLPQLCARAAFYHLGGCTFLDEGDNEIFDELCEKNPPEC